MAWVDILRLKEGAGEIEVQTRARQQGMPEHLSTEGRRSVAEVSVTRVPPEGAEEVPDAMTAEASS